MLAFLKQYKKLLLVLLLPYLAVLFVLVYPTDLGITAPGGLTPVFQNITIEGYEIVENFNTIHVYSYQPITLFQSIILKNDPTMEIYVPSPVEKDTSWRESYLRGQVTKHVSLKTSVIQAYELASKINNEISIDYHFAGLYVTYRPSWFSELKIGDHVVAINGESYEEHNITGFVELIANQDEFTLTVKRIIYDEIVEIDLEYLKKEEDLAMQFYPNYEITNASPSFELPGLDTIIGGPSGGLLQTLTIYASLVNINMGDDIIAGTGTISVLGNIGRIGGIVQKMYTANYNNVDVFFIPRAHLTEISGIKYTYIIVPVSTIREAVDWLNEQYNV